MRKKIFFIALAMVLLVLAIFFLIISSIKPPRQERDDPSNISPAPMDFPSVRKVEIDGVKTRDFLSRPIRTNSRGDVLFVENENYRLVYLSNYKQFLIDISTSSAGIREQAEKEFVSKLGISKTEACRLYVVVSSPYVPNPDLSMPRKTLTFCNNY